MALSTVSSISTALPVEFEKKLHRQWNRTSSLLSKLEVRMVGGQQVYFNVSFPTDAAGVHVEGADIASGEFVTDSILGAALPWGQYATALSISDHQIEVAASSSGLADPLKQIFSEQLLGRTADLTNKLNKDLFNGLGTGNSLLGLAESLKDDSGSYGGISRGTYASWKSNVDSSVSLASNADEIIALEEKIFSASGKRPNLIVTTPAILSKYGKLFDSKVQIVNDPRRGFEMPRPDFDYSFQGIPVMRDKDCPDGYMFMLNTDELYLAALPPLQTTSSINFALKTGLSSNGDDMDSVGLPFRLENISKTGSATKAFLRTTLQLVVNRPNAHGVLASIS